MHHPPRHERTRYDHRTSLAGGSNDTSLRRDIAINLRGHTVGETSASLCRLMGIGVPAVVSDIGWFAEIPDDCVRQNLARRQFRRAQTEAQKSDGRCDAEKYSKRARPRFVVD